MRAPYTPACGVKNTVDTTPGVLRWDESRVFKRRVETVKTKGYMHLDPKDPGI